MLLETKKVLHSVSHPASRKKTFTLLEYVNRHIEKLIAEREQNGPYTSLYDFCLRNHSREFNRKALEGLIKSGALDCVSDNRREMLYNIEGVLSAVENELRFSSQGQLNLFEEMGSPNTFEMIKVPEMTKEMLLTLEKEATGLYLSGHPMDDYKDILSKANLQSITDVVTNKYPDGKRVSVAGIISDLKVRQLKNNNLLATAKIEDFSASVNVTVFGNAYAVYKPVLSDNQPVILTGRISEREDRDIEIILEKAEQISESLKNSNTAPKYKKGLYLKVKNIDDEVFQGVKKVLAENRGDVPVYIVCTDTNKKLEAPKSLYVKYSELLQKSLEEILPQENIKFID